MFEFMFDAGNYQDRVVGRYDGDGTMVSTASVSDGRHPYETAFQHPDYNDGDMVIVEAYDSREQAADGHARWVEIMTNGPLPESLIDCQNSHISHLYGSLDGDALTFPRKYKT